MAGWKPQVFEVLHAVWREAEPFVPGALGAMVAQMMRPGLGMRTRFVQWTVSVIVFHFVSLAVAAVFHWPEAVGDVIGFFIAFLAFEALHAWRQAAVDAGVSMISGLPAIVKSIAESWGKRPGASTSSPEPEA
ncbi:MAG: hypothetical protein ACT6TH_14590 [Brevundimonas sp.]|uniref:hypothetical protein n=1 Tax=Brevundimonas sp. TaxID=1871086 RepID=UPI004033DDC7